MLHTEQTRLIGINEWQNGANICESEIVKANFYLIYKIIAHLPRHKNVFLSHLQQNCYGNSF